MIDAVLSFHTNPATCGVAKWNHQLAQRLGVPCLPFGADVLYPLISVKPDEIPMEVWPRDCPYDLFLHGAGLARWVTRARTVYAANPVIADAIRPIRPDVITAWCPATIAGNPHRGAITVLTFGMAHKLRLDHYRRLKMLLDATGEDYTVSLSTAVHEGSPWSAVADAGDQLRTVFGDRLRCLGYLLDDALAKELQECDAVALFFDPALRANNTTFWAALDAHQLVITNLDAQSPEVDGLRVVDISTLQAWPPSFRGSTHHAYTWDGLLQLMGVRTAV